MYSKDYTRRVLTDIIPEGKLAAYWTCLIMNVLKSYRKELIGRAQAGIRDNMAIIGSISDANRGFLIKSIMTEMCADIQTNMQIAAGIWADEIGLASQFTEYVCYKNMFNFVVVTEWDLDADRIRTARKRISSLLYKTSTVNDDDMNYILAMRKKIVPISECCVVYTDRKIRAFNVFDPDIEYEVIIIEDTSRRHLNSVLLGTVMERTMFAELTMMQLYNLNSRCTFRNTKSYIIEEDRPADRKEDRKPAKVPKPFAFNVGKLQSTEKKMADLLREIPNMGVDIETDISRRVAEVDVTSLRDELKAILKYGDVHNCDSANYDLLITETQPYIEKACMSMERKQDRVLNLLNRTHDTTESKLTETVKKFYSNVESASNCMGSLEDDDMLDDLFADRSDADYAKARASLLKNINVIPQAKEDIHQILKLIDVWRQERSVLMGLNQSYYNTQKNLTSENFQQRIGMKSQTRIIDQVGVFAKGILNTLDHRNRELKTLTNRTERNFDQIQKRIKENSQRYRTRVFDMQHYITRDLEKMKDKEDARVKNNDDEQMDRMSMSMQSYDSQATCFANDIDEDFTAPRTFGTSGLYRGSIIATTVPPEVLAMYDDQLKKMWEEEINSMFKKKTATMSNGSVFTVLDDSHNDIRVLRPLFNILFKNTDRSSSTGIPDISKTVSTNCESMLLYINRYMELETCKSSELFDANQHTKDNSGSNIDIVNSS